MPDTEQTGKDHVTESLRGNSADGNLGDGVTETAGGIELKTDTVVPPEGVSEALRFRTATVVTYTLLWILAGTIVLQYATVVVASCLEKEKSVALCAATRDLFQALLPVLAGLVGSAATYFFTRNKT